MASRYLPAAPAITAEKPRRTTSQTSPCCPSLRCPQVAESVSVVGKVVRTFAKCVHKGGQHHDVESGPSYADSIAEDDRDEKEDRPARQ
jgi:hypothetical protein